MNRWTFIVKILLCVGSLTSALADPSIEVLFSDERCYNSIGVCPSDTVNVTCNAYAFGLKQTTLGVTIPPDEYPHVTIILLYRSTGNQILPQDEVTVVSQSVRETKGLLDYELTMSLKGSVLNGGPIVCSVGDYNDSSSCRIADPPAIRISPAGVTCVNISVTPSSNGSKCVRSYVISVNSSLHEDLVDIEEDKPTEICHPSLCQALTTFTACAITTGEGLGNCDSSVNYLSSTGFTAPHNITVTSILFSASLEVTITWVDDPFKDIGTVTLIGWGQDKEKAQKLQSVTEKEQFTFSLNYSDIDESDPQAVFIVKTQLMNCTDVAYIYHMFENIVQNVSIHLEELEAPFLHVLCRQNVMQPNNFSIVVNYTSDVKTEVLATDYNTSVDIELGPLLPSTAYTYTVRVVDRISGGVIGWTVQKSFTTPDSTSIILSPTSPEPSEDNHIGVNIWGAIVGGCLIAMGGGIFIGIILIVVVVKKKRKKSEGRSDTQKMIELSLPRENINSNTGPLYAELNPASKQNATLDKEVSTDGHLYHVLESPTLIHQQNLQLPSTLKSVAVDEKENIANKTGVTYTEVEVRSTNQPPPKTDPRAQYADIKHNVD